MRNPSKTISMTCAVLLHAALILLLVLSFEKTLVIPAQMPSESDKPIIDAVMVNKEALNAEVARLESIERKKRQQEKMRQQELTRKENEARQKRLQEETLAAELKKKNEQLKKEAELQQLAQQKLEQERQALLKQQEAELKKIQKEKEAALLAKKKIEEQQKKAAEKRAQEQKEQQEKAAIEQAKQKELAKQKEIQEAAATQQQTSNVRVKPDEITRYAMMMRNKIHQYWRQPIGFDFTKLTCKIIVRLLPTGEVIDATVVQSSGNLEFDRSAELAVRKASPLPMPTEVHLAKEFNSFSFTFNPGGGA